jgi:REP element-mobilizing transposase RayT
MYPKPTYRRRLPHIYPENAPIFFTWHLHGSLPHARYSPPGKLNAGQAFVWRDRYLDRTRIGPQYLRNPEIAKVVVDSIHRGEESLGQYQLHAYAVMPNHVHLLITPKIAASRLIQSLKGFTAREANKLLGRSGQPFWQRESYDHWARNPEEFSRIKRYIEWNPVKAGLCEAPEDYAWSSVGLSSRSDRAEPPNRPRPMEPGRDSTP